MGEAAISELVFMDLETQSWRDLKTAGSYAYAKDPSTRIMCCVMKIAGSYHLWTPTACARVLWPLGFPEQVFTHHSTADLPQVMRDAMRHTFVAHNADGFDRLVWEEKYGPPAGGWIDTLPKARIAGYPGALDALGLRFCGIGKSPQATKILKKVCKTPTPPKPGELALLSQYNIADVLILEEVWRRVHTYSRPWYGDFLTMNARGVGFDRALAARILLVAEEHADRSAREIEEITGRKLKRDDLGSRDKVLAWVKSQGVALDNLRRETVDLLLDDPESFLLENDDGNDETDLAEEQTGDCPIAAALGEDCGKAC